MKIDCWKSCNEPEYAKEFAWIRKHLLKSIRNVRSLSMQFEDDFENGNTDSLEIKLSTANKSLGGILGWLIQAKEINCSSCKYNNNSV